MIGLDAQNSFSVFFLPLSPPFFFNNRPNNAAHDMGAPLSAGTETAEAVSGRR